MTNQERKVLTFQTAPADWAGSVREDPDLSRTVLVVDWDEDRARQIMRSLSRALSPLQVKLIANPVDLVAVCGKEGPNIIVASLKGPEGRRRESAPDQAGLEVLLALRLFNFSGEVIVYQDDASRLTIEEYCRPFALGASHFLDSSSAAFMEELREKVEQSLLRSLRHEHSKELNGAGRSLFESLGIVGQSQAMLEIFQQVRKAARFSDVTILITGESGTGKQRLAEAIHRLDEKKRDGPFVTVNCTAIPRELAESELFGHKRGAFTGASAERAGYFRMADKGTILLDEIGDLPMSLQPKLLRVLQEKKVSPVGADWEMSVDARVIAATNHNLEALLQAGKFRLDLYQRLSTFSIEVPPLRNRKEDMSPLVSFFVQKHKKFCSRKIEGVDPRVIEILATLDFPGNVRQLENLVLQILSEKESGSVIEIRDLPENLIRKVAVGTSDETEREVSDLLLGKIVNEGMSLPQTVEYCEKLLLRVALYKMRGNRTQTARMLRTTARTIFNKIQKYNLKISGLTY